MHASDQRLVSCLSVTEDRPAFIPFLLWGFERQRWPNKELVVVDSSRRATPSRANVRVISARHGASVAEKRNLALAAARGSAIAWFDDDDWQHPDRLAATMALRKEEAMVVGPSASWIADLALERAWRYTGFDRQPIFNGAVFDAEIARAVPFDERRRRGSDTVWLSEVLRRVGARGQRYSSKLTFFWLYHAQNLSLAPESGRLRRVTTRAAVEDLRVAIAPDAWADTERRLVELRERLSRTPSTGGSRS